MNRNAITAKRFDSKAYFRKRPVVTAKPPAKGGGKNNASETDINRNEGDDINANDSSSVGRKIFGSKSFFRGRLGESDSSNKTFGEKAFFRGKSSGGLFSGGASGKFACAIYGSTIPVILVVLVVFWYHWRERKIRRDYRLLGSFHDSRYPEFHFDPDCDDCDYKKAQKLREPVKT